MIDPVMWISEWNWSENEVMIGEDDFLIVWRLNDC